jgi:hypothetical protein
LDLAHEEGDTAMTINEALTALYDELVAEIPDPLRTRIPLALVWIDLCRLAGEEPPALVAAVLDEPIDLVAPTPPRATPQDASGRTRGMTLVGDDGDYAGGSSGGVDGVGSGAPVARRGTGWRSAASSAQRTSVARRSRGLV